MKANSIWQPKQFRVHNQFDFHIDDPSLYYCSILRYLRPHRQLVISVNEKKDNPEAIFYLGFEGVWYFQGPTNWQGSDFELAEVDERRKLLQRGFLEVEENQIEVVASLHQLFVLHKPKFNIEILAGSCIILKELVNS